MRASCYLPYTWPAVEGNVRPGFWGPVVPFETLAMAQVSHTGKLLLTIVLARISYDLESHLMREDRYLRGAA